MGRFAADTTIMDAELTVVCAVWHRQADLDLLFEQHVRSLLGQSEPVRVIYVVDGGLPLAHDDDRVTVVTVDRGIAFYEALMAGLALTDTEYFAALNLDDHYFADAAAQHLEVMRARRLDMLAGDWEIRFTARAHVTRPCYDLRTLRPVASWPPREGPGQRLGSGDGVTGTYGPAPVFRTAAVRQVGGYARRFGDGGAIRTISDFILWDRLARAGKRMARLPLVVGTYLSDPANQLEFRAGGRDSIAAEHLRYEAHGARV